MDNLKVSGSNQQRALIKIDIQLKFKKLEEEEFDLKYFDSYHKCFQNVVESFFKDNSNEPGMVITQLEQISHGYYPKSVILAFNIKSDDMDLKNYGFYFHNENVEILWEKISEEFKKTFSLITRISLKKWVQG